MDFQKGGKKMEKIFAGLIAAAIMITAVLPMAVLPILGASVEPITVGNWQAGNATSECCQASTYTGKTYQYSYKIDWSLVGTDYSVNATFPDGHTNTITISNNNGTHFDWSATNPIGCVIVKGGTSANIFSYDPQVGSDTGLYAPNNPNNNQPYGVSHVTFCWNLTLAAPSIRIDKIASVEDAFVGDKIWYNYTVRPGNVPLSNVTVIDNVTGSAAYVTGDTNGNNLLDPGETWIFTAYYIASAGDVGVLTNNATASGYYGGIKLEAWDTSSVNIWALSVNKTAATSFTRTYSWTIEKVGNLTEVEFMLGEVPETLPVGYNVTVDASYTDSNWTVTGTITVVNPAPIDAVINSIADIVSPDIAATVDFGVGVTFPYTLPAGGTLTGTYTASLPDNSSRTNTVTVTMQNYEYGLAEKVPSGTTSFNATACVNFTKAKINEIDKRISVKDDHYGYLGEVRAEDELPYTFGYSYGWPLSGEPGTYKLTNTASFETCDTKTTGSANWTVTVTVYGRIEAFKFYDANLNGVWDEGEPAVEGFKIQLLYANGTLIDEQFTNATGWVCFTVPERGTYKVSEVMPVNWVNTTATCYTVEVPGTAQPVKFGNVCLDPGHGGKTIGFWSNKNGQALININDVAKLNALNLYKPSGWAYPPFSSDLSTAKSQIRNYLLSANAKDMSWMLSAQLIGTMLNVQKGFLSNSTMVYVGPSSYVPTGFISIGEIIENANNALSGSDKAAQAYWKDLCDGLNNNWYYFVCPAPCYPIVY